MDHSTWCDGFFCKPFATEEAAELFIPHNTQTLPNQVCRLGAPASTFAGGFNSTSASLIRIWWSSQTFFERTLRKTDT
jgi:hypothetical protein